MGKRYLGVFYVTDVDRTPDREGRKGFCVSWPSADPGAPSGWRSQYFRVNLDAWVKSQTDRHIRVVFGEHPIKEKR